MRIYLFVGAFWVLVQAHILFEFNLSFKAVIFDALVTNLLIVLAGVATYNMLRFYKPAKENTLYIRIWAVLLTSMVAVSFKGLAVFFFSSQPDYLVFVKQSMPIRTVYCFLNIVILTIFAVLWFYFNDEQQKQKRLLDAEKLNKEAELVSLRQQLQPHFLFNSLNSINALVGTRPEEARKMIYQLSAFLRTTLRNNDQETFFLQHELEHLQLYLDIEKVRFGHRLNTNISTTPESLLCKIPPLIIQPLVENAIKFGLYDVIGNVEITLDCHIKNNHLIITITNPFDEITAAPKKGTGFGLNGAKRRLYLLFARNDLVETKHQNNLFTTTVTIPQNL